MADDARITWRGPAAKAAIRRGTETGLRRAADALREASLAVVPREHDDLADSARVDVEGLTAAVSYDTPYAVRQHEQLNLRHDRGETSKYLERPLRRARTTAPSVIAAAIREEIR